MPHLVQRVLRSAAAKIVGAVWQCGTMRQSPRITTGARTREASTSPTIHDSVHPTIHPSARVATVTGTKCEWFGGDDDDGGQPSRATLGAGGGPSLPPQHPATDESDDDDIECRFGNLDGAHGGAAQRVGTGNGGSWRGTGSRSHSSDAESAGMAPSPLKRTAADDDDGSGAAAASGSSGGVFVSKRLRGEVNVVPTAAAQLNKLASVRFAGLASTRAPADRPSVPADEAAGRASTDRYDTASRPKKDRDGRAGAATGRSSAERPNRAGRPDQLDRPKDRAALAARAALDRAIAEARARGGAAISRDAYKAVLRATVHDLVGGIADVADEDAVARLVAAQLAISALSNPK